MKSNESYPQHTDNMKLAEIFMKYSWTVIAGFSFISFGWSHHISRLVSFVTHWFVLCWFCLSRCSTNWSGTQCESWPQRAASLITSAQAASQINIFEVPHRIEIIVFLHNPSFFLPINWGNWVLENLASWNFAKDPLQSRWFLKDEALSSYLVTRSIITYSFRFWGSSQTLAVLRTHTPANLAWAFLRNACQLQKMQISQ